MADQSSPDPGLTPEDWEWAYKRVNSMCASALVDASRLGKKILKGFDYPDEIFRAAQDYRALAIVLSALSVRDERIAVLEQERDAARKGLFSHLTGEHQLAEPTYAELSRRTVLAETHNIELSDALKAAEQQLAAVQTQHERLREALLPFTPSGAGEWGRYLAWIVNGAPTREEGIAAAQLIQRWRVEAEEARALVSSPVGTTAVPPEEPHQ